MVSDCRVREQCVESDILALEIPGALLLQQGYKAIIISGVAVSSLRQCLHLSSTKTSRDTASIELESPGRLPGAWLREAGRGWKVSDKFLRERLTVNSDLWVASSPSKDIIELEDPHVPFPDSALTTFAADHSRGMTPYGLITSQGETGPQKRR
ncbi:hypothetical protein OUZ56_013476 [Daphnia magna]|uniref:Uncharacterized protein n=1 Tax=Daphnia magna TaxID=35525 RepID=A0ABQ9Z6T0_9CRUS|nr:hypothetical protein OUZ56_013476 [Daphnia magna]